MKNLKSTLRQAVFAGLVTCLHILLSAAPASAAVTCGATLNMDFSTINLVDGGTDVTSSEIVITCDGAQPGDTIRACVAVGAIRQMTRSPTGTITYHVSPVSPSGSAWPAATGTSVVPSALITIGGGGSGSGAIPIHGAITPGQSTAPTTVANSTYSGQPDVLLAWDMAAGHSDCSTVVANNVNGFGNVVANYVPACTINTSNDLNFGTISSTLSGISSSTTVSATCSAASAYTIGINNGLNGGTGPTTRIMKSGTNELIYGLYKDAGNSQVWGNIAESNTAGGSGTGSPVSLTVYGHIQPQLTPPAGTYTDTVIVSITY